MKKVIPFGRALPPRPAVLDGPDWTQANPRWIERALAHSQDLPTGGWFVVGASRELGDRAHSVTIADRDLVVFRAADGFVAGPDACPHMGASLADAVVDGDRVVCPWHGLRLGCEARGSWRPMPTFDDGVLLWVRLDDIGEELTDKPILPERPDVFIDAVVHMEATCEPIDVIANRLDPWHGAHFHPYGFARLQVIEIGDEDIIVRVAKRVAGPLCVEVDARFHCSDARTIVMTIVDGEGVGSVVETHATPLSAGRTAVIEANLASSDRKSFLFARQLSAFVRPFMKRSARRLWVDDCAYAERLYALRQRRESSGRGTLKLIK